MKVLSLFDGISCGQVALQRAGIPVEAYFASEVDKYAIKVTQNNYNTTQQVGDVTQWRSWDIDWASIDLLLGGSPCQGFSLVGKQLAFKDERSALFFEYVAILNHIKSQNPEVKFLLENVPMQQVHLEVITEELGVQPIAINANLLLPQSRLRYYWCNWNTHQPTKIETSYLCITDDMLYPATVRKGSPRPVKLTGDHFLCLTATYYKGVRADGRPALATREGVFDEMRESGEVRMLTPEECEKLQGLPTGYTRGISSTQRYKALGNGWAVPVIVHLLLSSISEEKL